MSWTIQRPPGRPVRRTDDNRLAVPLRLSLTDGHATDTELTLTLAEAEHLHAALCRALDSEPTPPTAPDRRQSVQASPGTAHIMGRTEKVPAQAGHRTGPRQDPHGPVGDGHSTVDEYSPRTWQQLTSDGGSVELHLVTNRAADPADDLVKVCDARTGLLMPKAAIGGDRSARGKARARWAKEAGLTEAELLDLLSVLQFDLSVNMVKYQEHLQLLMAVAGLRHDQQALESGAAWVAKMVRDGQRELTLAMVETAIDELALKAGPARAVLSIATLKPDPMAPDADHAIDWVDRFESDSEYTKRRPLSPNTWAQLQADIKAAPGRLPARTTAVSVTGSIRLAPAFLVGTTFRMVTGTDLAALQRGRASSQLWSTNDPFETALVPETTEYEIGQGDELAVAIAVATEITRDVLEYLREQDLPVGKLIVLAPPSGKANDGSVPGSTAANALAVGIRDHLRRSTRRVQRMHLFLACPMGLAILLGNRWNRLCQTIVYEDIKIGDGYEAAFTVEA